MQQVSFTVIVFGPCAVAMETSFGAGKIDRETTLVVVLPSRPTDHRLQWLHACIKMGIIVTPLLTLTSR